MKITKRQLRRISKEVQRLPDQAGCQRLFRHFHPGTTISHDELAYLQTGDDTHTIVYEYTASINNSI